MNLVSKNIKRIVFTGAPCTGKTSTINLIKDKGYLVFDELAREVIKEELNKNSNKVPWDNVVGFSKIVLERQLEHYNAAEEGLNFYDRGIPDLIGYLNKDLLPIFDTLEHYSKEHLYDKVFVFPPWENIYQNDSERKESFEVATILHKELMGAYTKLGYSPILVPKTDIQHRIDFIIDNIK